MGVQLVSKSLVQNKSSNLNKIKIKPNESREFLHLFLFVNVLAGPPLFIQFVLICNTCFIYQIIEGAEIDKNASNISEVVQKTAATFAPRASTATKNPAVPGTTLYTVFEVQGYASMLLGGVLSFNLYIWRLMGMWSIWMFSKLCFAFFAMYAWKLGWLQKAD